jgi:hypothetical protein
VPLLTVLLASYDLTRLTFILQVSLASSSAQSGQAAQVATTPLVDDPVAAGEEATEAAATTTATTTRLHPTLTPNHPHSPRPTPQPGGQACGLVRQLARPLATRWETATIAALRAVKQDRPTGSEMEAARNLGLRGRLEEEEEEEVEDLRGLHRLLADRGMNRRVSAGVVGDRIGKEVERKASCEHERSQDICRTFWNKG